MPERKHHAHPAFPTTKAGRRLIGDLRDYLDTNRFLVDVDREAVLLLVRLGVALAEEEARGNVHD